MFWHNAPYDDASRDFLSGDRTVWQQTPSQYCSIIQTGKSSRWLVNWRQNSLSTTVVFPHCFWDTNYKTAEDNICVKGVCELTDLVLSTPLAGILRVCVKVSRILALVRRRQARISRLLGDHHFHAIAADHLSVQHVDRARRVRIGVLDVTKFLACNVQQSTLSLSLSLSLSPHELCIISRFLLGFS